MAVVAPLCSDSTMHQSSSSSPSIKTASWTKTPSAAAKGRVLQKPRTLPAVVLEHVEAAAAQEKQTRASHMRHRSSPESRLGIASEQGGEEQSSSQGMTRQQKRAVCAFTSLHYPIASKSLGDAFAIGRPKLGGGIEGDRFETEECADHFGKQNSCPESSGDSLFLFPTMTRQRHLHGK